MTAHSTDIPADDRPLWPALRLGWARRCPHCGTGSMMAGYLKIAPACPECGTELHHHRADDGPAYLTILVVGKVVTALYISVYMAYEPPVWAMLTLVWSSALALSLYLLPRFKGALVALQWSRRMHGFDR